MRNYLTETKWGAKQDARPAYIWGLRNPQNGACYIWTDQHAAENTATPVIECDPATGEAKADAQPVRVCKVVAKYVDINTEQFLGWTFGAAAIVDPEKFLYCPDYAGEMSATFGNDATEL